MSLISSIKNHFYFKEIVLSKKQLENDFGEFPPFPLKDTEFDFKFYKVEVRWFGVIYNILNIGKKLVQSNEPGIHLKRFQVDGISDDIFNEIIKAAKSIKELINSNNKFTVAFAITIILPVVFIKFRKSILFKSTGFYLPVPGSENQITVRVNAGCNGLRVDSTISHEHLHYLQYMINENHGKKISNLDFINSKLIKKEKYKPYAQFLIYAFERNEVEARLHEIVLSYYRKSKELPLTLDGFINLLATCNEFSELVVSALEEREVDIKSSDVKFEGRDQNIAIQLKCLLSAFVDEELRYRFITEVLTVMYANLLMYYGDKTSSINFANKITRPNMYDEIYFP
ncbi:MAG: hypothetical protein IPJ38_00760 [Dechloromonas sp.]|uniref:Uncharacterized protein n=1 Tax=Candidatus Dechloromonas phosphorivorans TaxID=2899244 RepID=A0A935K778_9RHOO|nr:hypothetical protein [Candidatus Dechloromonas phosphorivorans]